MATLTGTVDRVIFEAGDDGYAVLSLRDGKGDEHKLTGALGGADEGDQITASGELVTHRTYGEQLEVSHWEPARPADEEGVIAFLRTLPAIGPVRAEQLVADFGAELVLDRIDRSPAKVFMTLRGIGQARALELARAWVQTNHRREVYSLLAPVGLARHAGRLLEEHGPDAARRIREDPYSLVELEGVGFLSADKLARAFGLLNPQARARAAGVHIIGEVEEEGSTYAELPRLIARGRELLGEAPDEAQLLSGLLVEGDRAFRHSTHRAERWCAATVAERASGIATRIPTGLLSGLGDELSEEQLAAIRAALTHRISVITGGPGTGKTTLVRGLVQAAGALGLRSALMAPTGRAASRLSELSGTTATTVHAALDWVPGLEPNVGPGSPLAADVVVLEEASMVDLIMFEHVLNALKPTARLVMVGDDGQLPPVGKGRPLGDVIESARVPVTRLTRIFRQADGELSGIHLAAQAINRGELPLEVDGQGFHWVRQESAAGAAEMAVRVAADRLKAAHGIDPVRDALVLAPMYAGAAGIDALNERLARRLNPEGKEGGGFRLGDRVITTRAFPEEGISRNTLLWIDGVSASTATLFASSATGKQLAVPFEQASGLRLAWASSVHRAQGSEIAAVVIVCHSSHSRMLFRKLLYTGVTRAKQIAVVVGDEKGLRRAVDERGAQTRRTTLRERLVEASKP